MQAKDIMHHNIRCCGSDSTLDDVAKQMWNDDVGIVPVVDHQNHVIGVVTDRDIAMAATLKHKPLWEITTSEVTAGKQCYTCHTDDDIHRVLSLMESSRIRRVPIIDEQDRLAGIISLKDLADHTFQASKAKKPAGITPAELSDTLKCISKPNLLQATA